MLTKNNTDEQIAELRKLLMVYIENTDLKISKHDKTIEHIIVALNNLIAQPPKTKRIGFNAGNWQTTVILPKDSHKDAK